MPATAVPASTSQASPDPALDTSGGLDFHRLTEPADSPGGAVVSPPWTRSGRLDAEVTRDNLRASMRDGAMFGVMVGAGETYLAAFALAVGLGEVSAGLVSSVPLLAGGIIQMVSPQAVRWLGSEKRWILVCATLQGFAFFPLVYAAITGWISLPGLLLVASVYWAGGLASGPAWNTWMESIVPSRIRPKYFARRTRLSQSTTLLGLVGGGVLLQWASGHDLKLLGFASLFLLAGLARMWSVYWLAMHQNVHRSVEASHPSVLASSTLRRFRDPRASKVAASERGFPVAGAESPAEVKSSISGSRLLVYLVAVQGCVQISGPFFAPYMLEKLQFSYAQFVCLLAIGFLAKVAALSWWAKIAHRGGARLLLWIGGVGIIPLSSLWILSTNFYWLAVVQAISGTIWAAYELGFFLLFFEALPVQNRTRMLTFYNLANTVAWCGGALIGAWLLHSFGTTASAYLLLFGISSIGRLLALSLLRSAGLRPTPVGSLSLRTLGVRPQNATVDAPILPSLEEAKSPPTEPITP